MSSKEQDSRSVTINHEEQTNRVADKAGALGKASVGAGKSSDAAKGGDKPNK